MIVVGRAVCGTKDERLAGLARESRPKRKRMSEIANKIKGHPCRFLHVLQSARISKLTYNFSYEFFNRLIFINVTQRHFISLEPKPSSPGSSSNYFQISVNLEPLDVSASLSTGAISHQSLAQSWRSSHFYLSQHRRPFSLMSRSRRTDRKESPVMAELRIDCGNP